MPARIFPGVPAARCVSPWLARKDADWHLERLYDFATALGATVVRTTISRTVIDVNRDPSGVSLYPGQATTGLCPVETFDGEPLYVAGAEPADAEIAERRARYFDPYHQALAAELTRLPARPRARGRLRLPLDPLGDSAALRRRAAAVEHRHQRRRQLRAVAHAPGRGAVRGARGCRASRTAVSRAATSRATTAGRPTGVHAIQMELACRGYMTEPAGAAHARQLAVALRGRTGRATAGHAAGHSRGRRGVGHGRVGGPHQGSAMTRTIRAARGPARTAKSWLTEAPLRMLMNNLDPDVAERPEDLVVYGGIGRAARNWECYDRIVATLTTLEDTETLLVQSGKPVGVFQTHRDAPRVLIANSNLVPHWATWEHFHELDRLGLMMYGQMTAGLVDLHRQPGHRAGHLRDVRRDWAVSTTAAIWPAAGSSRRASAAWAARSRWPPPWRARRAWRWNVSRAASTCACARATSTCRPAVSTRRWR